MCVYRNAPIFWQQRLHQTSRLKNHILIQFCNFTCVVISSSTWSRLGMIDILILSAVMHVQCLCFTVKTAATRFTLRSLFKLIIVSKFKKCLVVLCCQSVFWKKNFVCTALCSLYVFTKGQHTKPPFVLLKNFNQNGTYTTFVCSR